MFARFFWQYITNRYLILLYIHQFIQHLFIKRQMNNDRLVYILPLVNCNVYRSIIGHLYRFIHANKLYDNDSMFLGIWTDLPKLNPLRAQHGCALVELKGQQGVLVVGGDSGGTRLNDVR